MSQDLLANTKLINEMSKDEMCYFRLSGFAFVGDRDDSNLYVEVDFRVWILPTSHNNIPVKLSKGKIQVPERYRSEIEREISLGGGVSLAEPKGALLVIFT